MTYRKIELIELLPADVIITTDHWSPVSTAIRNLTGSSISRSIFSVSILFFLLSLSGCTTINKWRSRTPVPISEATEIGSEWIGITPPAPLVSRTGTSQRVNIYTEAEIDTSQKNERKTIRLKDGRITKIDAFLYDENGDEYELFISGGGGGVISFDRSSPSTDKYVYFPNGKYVKLKIRSQIPIKVEKIEWKADYSIDNML